MATSQPAPANNLPEGEPSPPRARFASAPIIAVLIAAGLVIRAILVFQSPEHGFFMDHLHFMAWSDWAISHSPTKIYDFPEQQLMNVRLPRAWSGTGAAAPFPVPETCNYPPGAGYLLWFQGALWNLIDRDIRTLRVGQELSVYKQFAGRTATSRVANTIRARAVNAIIPTMADIFLAWGVMRLVRTLRRPHHPRWQEVTAFGIALLAPPVVLGSAWWMQFDSCLACLLVWTICFIVERWWVPAGFVFGAALTLKAQALLFIPTIALAILARRGHTMGETAPRRVGRFVAPAALSVTLLVLPFSLASRSHPEGGWLRWCWRAYVMPIREQFPLTTLRAFNVWWLDSLWHGGRPEALQPATVTPLGLTKGQLGVVLYAASLVVAGWLCLRRWRNEPPAWTAFAALSLLAAFTFPTRVHERYFLYCVPFLITTAAILPRWIPVVVAILLVGTFEMTWYLWLAPADAPPESPPESVAAARWSAALAALTLASFGYGCLSLLPGTRRRTES